MSISLAEVLPDKETISLSSKVLPCIKDWKVGKTYTIDVKVRMTGVHEDNYDNKKRLHASFEIIKAEECSDE